MQYIKLNYPKEKENVKSVDLQECWKCEERKTLTKERVWVGEEVVRWVLDYCDVFGCSLPELLSLCQKSVVA